MDRASEKSNPSVRRAAHSNANTDDKAASDHAPDRVADGLSNCATNEDGVGKCKDPVEVGQLSVDVRCSWGEATHHFLPTTSEPSPAARPPRSAPSVVAEVMSSFCPLERAVGPRSSPMTTRVPEMTPVS